jgi:hypothetical protein
MKNGDRNNGDIESAVTKSGGIRSVDLNRRDFGKLTAAALSGAMAGALLGGRGAAAAAAAAAEPAKPTDSRWLQDPHICCGLNTCKGHGKGAANSCAGTGQCATVAAHGCAGQNACAGQGPTGENSCKGKGGCAVPVSGAEWTKARASWEAAMTRAGRKFGAAPKECGQGA